MVLVTATFEEVDRPPDTPPPIVEALIKTVESGRALRVALNGVRATTFRAWAHQQARRYKLAGRVTVQNDAEVVAWFEKPKERAPRPPRSQRRRRRPRPAKPPAVTVPPSTEGE